MISFKSVACFFILSSSLLLCKDYKGGEYRTKEAYTYGRFEVNYKTSNREGMLSTFFTYFDGTPEDEWEYNKWNEIDLEILGRYDDNIQFNTITSGQQNHVRSHYINFNPSEDYHTYAFEWAPEYVAWFVDGEEVYRQTAAHIATLTHPQKIMMNIWNPVFESWVGDWNPNVLPAFAFYDWVSYYSYTPGTGSYGTESNFTHEWTDEFDSWDQERWQKAKHTFGGNNCDFIPENVVFQDGKMILCLTDSVNTGYTDKTKPTVLWARKDNNKINVVFSEELDKTSAENIANYTISGVTINSAVQQSDERIVSLDVTGFNNGQTYNLITRNVNDNSGNIMSVKASTIINNIGVTLPLKINVGGPAWEGYLGDQEWDETTEYGYMEGTLASTDNSIANTEEDEIYKDERNGLVSYKVRLPNGTYNIELMFAENIYNQAGSRIFDISLEDDSRSVTDIDLYQITGKNSAHKIAFNNVAVSDNILDLYFGAVKGYTVLNGIIVHDPATGILEDGITLPGSFSLEQNYPNPFNPISNFGFRIADFGHVEIKVYDIMGREVAVLVNEEKPAGEYTVRFDAGNLASGVYYYTLRSGGLSLTRKMIVLK